MLTPPLSWQWEPRGQSVVLVHVTFGIVVSVEQCRAPSTLGLLHPSHGLGPQLPVLQTMAHVPLLSSCLPAGQLQAPPPGWQTCSAGQLPHKPPQPSSPHTLPTQVAVQLPVRDRFFFFFFLRRFFLASTARTPNAELKSVPSPPP